MWRWGSGGALWQKAQRLGQAAGAPLWFPPLKRSHFLSLPALAGHQGLDEENETDGGEEGGGGLGSYFLSCSSARFLLSDCLLNELYCERLFPRRSLFIRFFFSLLYLDTFMVSRARGCYSSLWQR